MVPPLLNFETDRLKARKIKDEDLNLLHSMNQNAQVMATLGGICDQEETKKRLEWNLNQWRTSDFGLWFFFEKGTGEFVGRGGIRRLVIDEKEEVEVACVPTAAFRDI